METIATFALVCASVILRRLCRVWRRKGKIPFASAKDTIPATTAPSASQGTPAMPKQAHVAPSPSALILPALATVPVFRMEILLGASASLALVIVGVTGVWTRSLSTRCIVG